MPWPVTTQDLAPGDSKAAALDLTPFDLTLIRRADDPLFERAYTWMWEEFGATGGMEQRGVLDQRFQLGSRFYYEMALVSSGGDFVAVRDHTAALSREGDYLLVHLSHNLVAPRARRTGLAGWMRALPMAAARRCLVANDKPLDTRLTLLAEMDYLDPSDPLGVVRLQAYERAGFLKVDPTQVTYFQPDFRPLVEIDATGGARPHAYQLLVRRVGGEEERVMTGAELKQLVTTLYDIYGSQFRAADMAHPALSLESYPAADAMIPLIPPSQC